MAVELGPYPGEHAVAQFCEADSVPVSGQRAQTGDGHDRKGRECQQRARLEPGQARNERRVAPGDRANDVVENKFQRPGFEQAQTDFCEQRRQRTCYEQAMLADLGPEMNQDPPQAGQALLESFRSRHRWKMEDGRWKMQDWRGELA